MHVKTYCLQSKYLQLESIPNASRDVVNRIPISATERTIWPNSSPIASGNAPITSCTVAFGRFDGKDLYPTKEEKGAMLGYTLISNHAFVDGNKRIGVYVMLTFLEVNGIRIKCTDSELTELGLGVAAGEIKYEELLDWILDHET